MNAADGPASATGPDVFPQTTTPSLSIARLDIRQQVLGRGSLYWLLADRPEDADLLAVQVLAGLDAAVRAALVCAAATRARLLGELPAQAGPGELRLLDLPPARAARALQRLAAELDRATPADCRLVLLRAPAACWGEATLPRLSDWIRQLKDWLAGRDTTLLLITDGLATELREALLQRNEQLSGLAQLYRAQGGARYLLHFWHNPLGVSGTADFALQEAHQGFAVRVLDQPGPRQPGGDDQRRVYAQREVLEGAPTPALWQLFDTLDALRDKAAQAHAATVVFCIDGSHQVEDLARTLHTLRERQGPELKLVLREMTPCLRYRDEQLLLTGGANLVVPYGSNLSRFLTLLDSVQGQVWRRSMSDDFDATLQRLRPLPLRGVLSPLQFADAVRQMWRGTQRGEIIHQLVRLAPMQGLDPASALGQIKLRRDGDIACIADGAIHLFLFACRAESVEPALDNTFTLPWQELFQGYQCLPSLDPLDSEAFRDASAPRLAQPEPANDSPAPRPRARLRPSPLRIELAGSSP